MNSMIIELDQFSEICFYARIIKTTDLFNILGNKGLQ